MLRWVLLPALQNSVKLPHIYTLILLPVIVIVSFVCGFWTGQKPTRLFPDGQIYNQPQTRGIVAGTESATLYKIQSQTKADYFESTLWDAVNNYRSNHGLTAWAKDNILCAFVHKRLTQLNINGALDNHQGFHAQTSEYLSQKRFHKLAENTAQGYKSPKEIVNGWIGSLPHHALLLSTEITAACAETEGNFSVLIGGRR